MYQRLFILAFLTAVLFVAAISAQTTVFTYQGRLTDSSLPASGTYQMQFALFDADAGGIQIGTTVENAAVTVTAGVFTVQLDFGAGSFRGPERYLEISVRRTSNDTYSVLAPRQRVTSVPYAVQSKYSSFADNADALGGVPATDYVQQTDLRMTDSRNPLPNSNNYIQNTGTLQSGGNFNIDGTGSASIFNANSSFNIRGNRIFTINGVNNTNTVAGVFAGANLDVTDPSLAGRNTFFGLNAGKFTTTGCCNSFFGLNAGVLNTTGRSNVFIGDSAGQANTIGSYNTLIGAETGNPVTGNANTVIGYNARVSDGSLNNATAIGSGAVVSTSNTVALGSAADHVEIPGNLLKVSGDIMLNGTKYAPAGDENLRILRGTITNGAISGGTEFTISRTVGASFLRITFTVPFSATPSITVTPVVTAASPGGRLAHATVESPTNTTVLIHIYDGNNNLLTSGESFHFVVIGPK